MLVYQRVNNISMQIIQSLSRTNGICLLNSFIMYATILSFVEHELHGTFTTVGSRWIKWISWAFQLGSLGDRKMEVIMLQQSKQQ